MKPSFFITGTDTGVGKTEAACLLARSLRAQGRTVGVMKPVETGCAEKDGRLVPADALRLIEASGTGADLDLVNPYRFTPPLAPALAARLFNTEIDLGRIRDIFIGLSEAHEVMIVEGAGGLLVPVAEGKTMADLALCLGAPLVIVSANRLGTLNHTLLTVCAARQMGLPIKGIILNDPAPAEATDDPSRAHNRGELERLSGVPILFEMSFSPDGTNQKVLGKSAIQILL